MPKWADTDWGVMEYRYVHLVEFVRDGDWKKVVERLGKPPDKKVTQQEIRKHHERITLRPVYREDILAQDQQGAISATFEAHFHFTEKTHRDTVQLVRSVVFIGAAIVFYAKEQFRRARPSQYDPSLITPGNRVIDMPAHPSYPSGHSFQSHLVACALSAVGLDSEALINLADSIALNREIAGLHYPSDSEAGTELAAQIWPLLIKSPELAATLGKAKLEWKKA